MTEAQRRAIGWPCLLGEETAHLRFRHLASGGTLVLTINAGFE